MSTPIQEPSVEREIVTHAADHEVFLSFIDDVDAELFIEWWNIKGFELFRKWGEKEKSKRI